MFKIKKLTLINNNEAVFDYIFEFGINYIKGKNDSGKTEFYSFIDYMFGSSIDLSNKIWYKNSLNKSILIFEYDGISYSLMRSINSENNYFKYESDCWAEPLSLSEYKYYINKVFCRDEIELKKMRYFTGEDLSFRTFTLFNFLGELSLGKTNDFFEKCVDIKYSIKLDSILNYIFNKNQTSILSLKEELASLESRLLEIDGNKSKSKYIIEKVNINLSKLGVNTVYTGKNNEKIRCLLLEFKELKRHSSSRDRKTISELESIYNNLDNQINFYENAIYDTKKINRENENRKLLLDELSITIESNEHYTYLLEPIKEMAKELENNISFNNYITNKKSIDKLKKQRKLTKYEMTINNYKFNSYSLTEKAKFIVIIDEYLVEELHFNQKEFDEIKVAIKEIKRKIRYLQNEDDKDKISKLSTSITNLYNSAIDVSDIVQKDNDNYDGFKIKYVKKGNILQPMRIINEVTNEYEDIYLGSHARHTLFQLCGYLAFIELLIKDKAFPIIPFLIIDHISKPFDNENMNAIGEILKLFYKNIGIENVQIIIFDDEIPEKLSIKTNNFTNLVDKSKSGFNPFFVKFLNSKNKNI